MFRHEYADAGLIETFEYEKTVKKEIPDLEGGTQTQDEIVQTGVGKFDNIRELRHGFGHLRCEKGTSADADDAK